MALRKRILAVALTATGLTAPVQAQAEANSGAYAGIFGGAGASIGKSLRQRGAVHINDRFSLPIDAQGSTGSSKSLGLAGLQLGYEWDAWRPGSTNWGLRPAVELEGIYLGKHSPTGEMPVHPAALGTQYVTVPTKVGLLMANAVFSFETPYSSKVFPYVGAGAGVAWVSIKNSYSDNPMEPGINHFNSDPDASATAFAMQFKAGIRAQISKKLHVFTEYRYLTVAPTRYNFGATDYPGLHLPTADWRVDMGRQKYNLFVAGLQYRF